MPKLDESVADLLIRVKALELSVDKYIDTVDKYIDKRFVICRRADGSVYWEAAREDG